MELLAISPIDGRYAAQVKSLAPFYSEFGLIHYRVRVEIEYLLALRDAGIPQLKGLDKSHDEKLRNIYKNFSLENAQQIKDTEKVTNHDVKAVEYFIKDEIQKLGLGEFTEFIHFGLTSQDINNTSIPLLIKESLQQEILPFYKKVIIRLKELAHDWKDISMLARTHGQPASPTRLGKEFLVFVERLESQIKQLEAIPFSAKFGGATGNFNAHYVAYPGIDWEKFAFHFVEKSLGLNRSKYTTQIEHYDNLGSLFDAMKRVNTILIDLNRDVWQYIAMNYFKQKIKEGEIGSSAMPHKVNPIDFENSEGNLGVANALFEHFSAKLPVSRLQRDLTDSTVLRNVGVPVAHTYIALRSTLKGIDKLELNKAAIDADLNENWAVVAEAIQTILRREGYPKPYEALKALTRKNEKITETTISEFIKTLNVSDAIKAELSQITPFSYTGIIFS